MDRTVLYREIVRIAEKSSTDGTAVVPKQLQPPSEPDAFTRETNSIARQLARITASLRHLRPRYLALSGSQQMTEAERDDFDYTTRQLLQREQRRVRALEQREQQRREQQAHQHSKFAARWLGNPDAEGIEQTLAEHRQGMFFYLNMQLQTASQTLAELQGVRMARGEGRRMTHRDPESMEPIVMPQGSAIPDIKADVSSSTEPLNNSSRDNDSSPYMLLMQEEHNTLLEDLNATLSKAQKAEQSLREIGELQTELSQHLATQSSQLNSLTSDAFRTTSDVSAANEQLERAKKSSKRASRVIIMSSLATGIFLLLLNGR